MAHRVSGVFSISVARIREVGACSSALASILLAVAPESKADISTTFRYYNGRKANGYRFYADWPKKWQNYEILLTEENVRKIMGAYPGVVSWMFARDLAADTKSLRVKLKDLYLSSGEKDRVAGVLNYLEAVAVRRRLLK